MLPRTALLIDGGVLRVFARKVERDYNADFIQDFARAAIDEDEHLLRVFYYDAPAYAGIVKLPISGFEHEFRGGAHLLDEVARRERFAVRRGSLKFRGWRPKRRPGDHGERYFFRADEAPTDQDFQPVFEQKGVDMRIGLDIANFTETRAVDRILLATTDGDLVAAMKYARRAGLEVGVVQLPFPMEGLYGPLLEHSDFVRQIPWRNEPERGPIDVGD